jgi:hypothetical protein
MPDPVRFDAYSATLVGPQPSDLLQLVPRFHGDQLRDGKGFHTFASRWSILDDAGTEVAAVSHGGRQGERVMLEVKGERTPGAVEALRSAWPHRCTRVDSCVDFERPGAFEALLDPVMRAKADFHLYGERRGDWDQPELGRSQYLGANASAIRARLYEKGKQPEFRHLARFDLCRLEVQIRPAKDARDHYATLGPLDVWGASKWTRQLAAEVLEQHLDPHPPGTVRKDPSRERALRWMCEQYGPHLTSLSADLGGWDVLGLTLREMVDEARRRQQTERRLRTHRQ